MVARTPRSALPMVWIGSGGYPLEGWIPRQPARHPASCCKGHPSSMTDASASIEKPWGTIALDRLRSRGRYALAVAVCGLTGALGIFRLGAKSFWTDEAFSEAMARLGVSTMGKAIVHGDAFNGLYYGFLHIWQFGGHSETWLRLPSAAFGLLAAYTLFSLNRRLFGARVALVSALLLAVNTFFVYYEQDARTYTLAVFLVVLATYLFVLALENGSTNRWLGYGLVGALAIYAHFFSAFVIAAHLISIGFRRRRPRLRDVVAGYGLTALLVAPLMAVILRTDSLQRRFIDKVHLGSFRWLFLNLTGAGGVPGGGGTFLLFAYFASCCLAIMWVLASVTWRRPQGSDQIWSNALVFSWLAVPILGSFAVSMIRSPIFYPRYLIVALPPLVTIAGIGIAGFRHRWLQVVAAAALVSLSIHPLVSYYRGQFKEGEDWRTAVAYVTRAERPGDGVIFLSRYGRRPFEYYLRRFHDGLELSPVYPGVPWGAYVPVLADANIESTTTAAARLRDGYQRVWVILLWEGFRSVDENPGPVRMELDSYYQEEARQAFGHQLQIRLYRRTGG
jgi:mannosyltransferase